MNTSRKVGLFVLIALVCVAWQPALYGVKFEPEIAGALEACSSLEEFTRWISELSGETEASIHGKSSQILTRYASTQGAINAQEYLREQFYALGLETELRPVPGYSNNVIAHLPGTTWPEEVVIICAHYDSISEDPMNRAPGANDNASGTAGVLTAASILRNFRFERTVEFCLFTAEEEGLIGSEVYAQECQAAGKNIVGVINMDMIIHPTDDRQPSLPLDLDICRNDASQSLAGVVESSIETYTTVDVEVHLDTTAGSDHASFWAIGANAVEVAENTANEIWGGATTVYHTTSDLITQTYADLPFGLSVARGVAAAGMRVSAWERSSLLPFGVTTSVGVDGTNNSDFGEHRASVSLDSELGLDGAVAECDAENLVIQATATAWSRAMDTLPHEALSHSTSFETFIPRSTTVPEGEPVSLELTLEGAGEFTIEGSLKKNLYANCRLEVWGRSIESLSLFDGAVSLTVLGIEVGGDFSQEDFVLQNTASLRKATLSDWNEVIPFSGKVGQPVTLCMRLSQMAYVGVAAGEGECTWTQPVRVSLAGATPDVSLEVAGFAQQPQVFGISSDEIKLSLIWSPFSQGVYTVEHSEDLVTWTPLTTTPFTVWQTEDWISGRGFYRVRSE
ncbi:MAG: M20/M25/M40 family metallo-hydrolase [bacterium]|nr:M20/M25/M40 family metallo-hydrolase [bacterium]